MSPKMENLSLALVSPQKRSIPKVDWSSQTLRKCLSALGVTEVQMRYRKGARTITEFWKDDIQVLVDIAKLAWKKQVVLVHEANSGGDPEHWKLLNTIYSTILRKLYPYIRKQKNRRRNKILEFECMICGDTFKKKIVSWVQYKSSLCNNHECKKEYYRRRSRKERQKQKIDKEIFCEHPECKTRLIVKNWKGRRRYCSDKCRLSHWRLKNESKIKERQKIHQEKRPKWKERWVTLTPEKQEEYRIKHAENRNRRRENESPEKRTKRLSQYNERMKEYRKRRAATGNPIKTLYVKREVWLAKKKEQLKDKPWLYETILQKYLKPDGTISSVALK